MLPGLTPPMMED